MALPCPSCKTPLGMDLKFIMRNQISACPNCNTIFNFQVNDEIKQSFKEAMGEISKIKKQYKGVVKFG